MRRLGLALVVLLLVGGCSSGSSTTDHLTVLAAQSLAPSFPSLKTGFEADHKHVIVEGSFGGSSALATQIQRGAPGDVFVSADDTSMQKVTTATAPVTVATNLLEIVVPAGNPKHIQRLSDLNRAGLVVALCDNAVPCGGYAAQAFAEAGFAVPSASKEANVAGVMTKVSTGNADAGIVYVTDVLAAGANVTGVEIPPGDNVVARYLAAVLKSSTHPKQARAFADFLRSPAGQRVLRRFGFGAP